MAWDCREGDSGLSSPGSMTSEDSRFFNGSLPNGRVGEGGPSSSLGIKIKIQAGNFYLLVPW